MNHQINDVNLIAGIVGGTFFSSIVNIGTTDVLTTSFLAVIGASVSFFVSVLLKYLFKQLKKRFHL